MSQPGHLSGNQLTLVGSLAAYFLTGVTRRGRIRCLKHIGPMIEERLRHLNEHGNEWDGKPVRFFFLL